MNIFVLMFDEVDFTVMEFYCHGVLMSWCFTVMMFYCHGVLLSWCFTVMFF
jgi:hypothetical protein